LKTLIKDITNLQTGLFAKPAGVGDLVYLQSKHFNEKGELYANLYPDLPAEGISEKHLLKNGDVLFAAKGAKNFAAVLENHNLPAVASTSFFVLRINNGEVLPHYLAWFLNHPATLAILKGQAIGTSIPSISKQVLEEIEIPVPALEIQDIIIRLNKLRNKEKELKQRIESLREKQIQQKILNAIK
jgi:restriction endonuclease S subunit